MSDASNNTPIGAALANADLSKPYFVGVLPDLVDDVVTEGFMYSVNLQLLGRPCEIWASCASETGTRVDPRTLNHYLNLFCDDIEPKVLDDLYGFTAAYETESYNPDRTTRKAELVFTIADITTDLDSLEAFAATQAGATQIAKVTWMPRELGTQENSESSNR